MPLQASDKEMKWVIRISVVVTGIIGTALTFPVKSVLVFWILGADIAYTIIFPQLICVIHFNVSNGYGATAGFVIGAFLRTLSGEPILGIPPIIHFPGCTLVDGVYVQYSPIKTICMLSVLVSILVFSYLSSLLFNKGLVPDKWDVFKVKRQVTRTPTGGDREVKKEEDAQALSELMLNPSQ